MSHADTSPPCDIYAAAGTPCVAAHSSVRALVSGYNGPLYQLTRNTDGATHDVGVLSAGGYADAADHDAFCGTVSCTITKIYDQTPRHNDLALAPAGQQGGASVGADASTLAVTAGGHKAYGVWITQHSGYRNARVTSGVAINGQPEGVYMVASGTHTNAGCCFDYGNAEKLPQDDKAGTMDAVSLENKCYFRPCTGQGPWVEADLEEGLFQGGDGGSDPANTGNASSFVTAMLKNNGQSNYTLKGGDAQTGTLTAWPGQLPPAYTPMRQEGGIILGIGGDDSDYDVGTFFEGVMTAGYPTDAADNAVQANIASVGYAGQTAVPNNAHSIQSGATATILDNNGATAVYGLGADGQIYENHQTIPGGGGWTGWLSDLGTSVGGPFVSSPSVFVDSAGKTVVTAIDTSGTVEENFQQAPASYTWSGWHTYNRSPMPPGVRFIGTPYATKDVNGVNVTYATGTDGAVYEDYFAKSTGLWSGWELYLGANINLVSPPSVFSDPAGHLVVTAIDSSGTVEEDYQENPGSGPWHGWFPYNNSPMPAGVRFVGTPFSTHDGKGVNVTYVTGTDGNIYENYLNRSTGLWQGWELNLGSGGHFVSSPSVFVDSAGKTVVTAIDSAGTVWEDFQTVPGGSPWSGWHTYTNSPLPAGVTFAGMPNSLKDKNGTNITYALGSDGKVYENYLTPQNGWFGWELALGTPAVRFGAL